MNGPIILSWSGGKDCSLALHALQQDPRYTVAGLLTTITAEYDRISMHGVRRILLEQQAVSLRLPLTTVELSAGTGNDSYEMKMGEALAGFRSAGIHTVAFGDLYLEDVRRYREEMMARVGMQAIFPLWGSDTTHLAEEFITRGYRAVIACVDTTRLHPDFAGRPFDEQFLADLPEGADPCGENGEFHTFVSDGPPFHEPVLWLPGERVLREARFEYFDLLPA